MSIHAEICPVCKGTGKYIEYNKYKEVTFIPYIEKTCHGCNGKGWVTIEDNKEEE